jgi:uncharacterized protein (DUF1778 family)
MARLGRPTAKCTEIINFKVTEQEKKDLRKCAIAEGLTMTDFLRRCIANCKQRHKRAGDWPEESER